MIGKILDSTKGKPCSCPSWKQCKACTVKKAAKKAKPHVIVEEPSRLPVPIIVNYSKQNPVRFQDLLKRRIRWKSRKSRKQQYESNPRGCFNICQWYKKKRALKQLTEYNKKEKERRRREEYEQERINDIIRWEQAKLLHPIQKYEPKPRIIVEEKQKEVIINEPKYEPVTLPAPKKTRFYKKKPKEPKDKPITWSAPARKVKKKNTCIKETSANTKPRYVIKRVPVKKYSPKDTITNRFVNCCYRICCQFYCCLTCVLVIAFVVIFIL